MTDYTKLSGPDMLHEMGQDAYKWTESFFQHNPDANIDYDTMVGWFANAIMHTLDTERGTIHNGDHAQYLADRLEAKGVTVNPDVTVTVGPTET